MHHSIVSDSVTGRVDHHFAIDEPMDFGGGECLDFANEFSAVHFGNGDRGQRHREKRDSRFFRVFKLKLSLSLSLHPFLHVGDLLDSLVTFGQLSVSHDSE